MKLDISHFDISHLMEALGAAESALLHISEDPATLGIFKGQVTSWAKELQKLSKTIAEESNK